MQYLAADGRPRVLGFGRASRISCAQGYIYRVVAPGLSVRAHKLSPGISLAIQTTLAGLDLAPWHIVLGSERSFGIPFPAAGCGVLQLVCYSARNPNASIINRKETE
jgi:hypothetical protein